eukprot:12930413-Prorocentrum_lima.AAC.1
MVDTGSLAICTFFAKLAKEKEENTLLAEGIALAQREKQLLASLNCIERSGNPQQLTKPGQPSSSKDAPSASNEALAKLRAKLELERQ